MCEHSLHEMDVHFGQPKLGFFLNLGKLLVLLMSNRYRISSAAIYKTLHTLFMQICFVISEKIFN